MSASPASAANFSAANSGAMVSGTTLDCAGELALVAWLRGRLPTRPDVAVGPGDDCAVADAPERGLQLVFKSDPVTEGRHFPPGTDPRLVGRKALGRVLSDFAAMGAEPRWALVDFAAPGTAPLSFAQGVLEGIAETASRHGVAVVGGDVSDGPVASLHVFAAGVVARGTAMLRSAARPGDVVFATGAFGRSFESGRHLAFEPRLREGDWLRRRGVRCCIDVSDGLCSELWHLAEESCAVFAVDSGAIPLAETCESMPDPLIHALGDGEDFELLFTAPPSVAEGLVRDFEQSFPDVRCTQIGRVVAPEAEERGGAVMLDCRPLPRSGYEHFAPSQKKT